MARRYKSLSGFSESGQSAVTFGSIEHRIGEFSELSDPIRGKIQAEESKLWTMNESPDKL